MECLEAETIWLLSFLTGRIRVLLQGERVGTVYTGCYLHPGFLDMKPCSTSARHYLRST